MSKSKTTNYRLLKPYYDFDEKKNKIIELPINTLLCVDNEFSVIKVKDNDSFLFHTDYIKSAKKIGLIEEVK